MPVSDIAEARHRHRPTKPRRRRHHLAGESVAHLLGLEETIDRINRFASLIDEDGPLWQALACDGAVDRLMRPGGLVDRLPHRTGAGPAHRRRRQGEPGAGALGPGGSVARRERSAGAGSGRRRSGRSSHWPKGADQSVDRQATARSSNSPQSPIRSTANNGHGGPHPDGGGCCAMR